MRNIFHEILALTKYVSYSYLTETANSHKQKVIKMNINELTNSQITELKVLISAYREENKQNDKDHEQALSKGIFLDPAHTLREACDALIAKMESLDLALSTVTIDEIEGV